MADCRVIYYESTTSSIQLGDFLYQNQALTIPASLGYYGWGITDKWYQTDSEGVVIATGSCPIIVSASAVLEQNAFNACESASFCNVYSGSYHLWYDFANTQSFLPTVGYSLTQPPEGGYFYSGALSLAGTASTYFSSSNSPNYGTSSYAFAGALAIVTPIGIGNAKSLEIYGGVPQFIPTFTGSNSLNFRASANSGATRSIVVVSGDTAARALNEPSRPNNNTLTLDITKPFSFEAWIKPSEATSRTMTIFSKKQVNDVWTGYDFTFNTGSAGKIGITLNTSPSTGSTSIQSYQLAVVSTQQYTSLNWQQIVATYDGSLSGSGIKLYRNGELIPSTQVGLPNVSGSLTTFISFQIGDTDYGDTNGSDRYFSGRMGQLKIYKNEISSKIVKANYNYYSSSYTN